MWDTRQQAAPVMVLRDTSDRAAASYSCVAVSGAGLVVAGTHQLREESYLLFWDTRQGGQLSLLYLPHVPLGGDLSAISMVTTLHSLYLLDTGLTGDLESLSQMKQLNDLDLTETNVHGDLSALSDLPLQNIWLSK